MAFVDPYFDSKIGTLRNLLGAQTASELELREAQIVFSNELVLKSINIPRTNDLTELLLIHNHLFKNIYDWAGNIRTIDIKKQHENAEYFLIVSKITDAANYVFTQLGYQNYLKDMTREGFIKQIAYFYDQLNYIHPFREGNGRTQRIFWSRVAEDAGFKFNWTLVIGDENDEASRLAAENSDRSALETMIEKIIEPL